MENVKKQLQENQTLRNMFIAFVTFFLMIVAIMSNSIVSALTVKDDDGTYDYIYFVERHCKYTNNSAYDLEKSFIYFNSEVKFQSDIITEEYGLKYVRFSTTDGSKFYLNTQLYKDGKLLKSTVDKSSTLCFIIAQNSCDYGTPMTNCQSYIDGVKNITDGVVVPELKIPPTPTIKAEQVGGIVPAITKIMKVIIPVGLMIFGVILGIYLIKRLVGYFL